MSDPHRDINGGTSFSARGWIQYALLFAASVLLVAFRVHAFDVPLETDECNYAYIAARLLDGEHLYVDLWDHQPPGVFMLFAGVIALFGDAPVVFRLLACGFSIASMMLIFGIVRRFVGSWPAIGAALLFAIVSSDPGTAGEGCQREVYMNTLILAAWYLVARRHGDPEARRHERERKDPLCSSTSAQSHVGFEPPRHQDTKARTPCATGDLSAGGVGQVLAPAGTIGVKPTSLTEGIAPQVGRAICPPNSGYVRAHFGTFMAAGLCLGLASLIKTVVVTHWVGLALWITLIQGKSTTVPPASSGSLPTPRRQPDRLGRTTKMLLALAAGPLLVWGGTFGYFALTDRWTEFVDAVFTFNLGYSGDKSLGARFLGFFTPDRHPFIFDSALPLWIAGALAALVTVVHLVVKRDPRSLNVLFLLTASFVAVCLPGRSWPHYYYLMIPPLVICTTYALGILVENFDALSGRAARGSTAVGNGQGGSTERQSRKIDTGATGRLPASADLRQSSGLGIDSECPTSLSPPLARGEASMRRLLRALAAILFMTVLLTTCYTQYRDYLSRPPFGITVKRYNSRDFWGRGQGEYVRRVTEPDDTIFVFGNEASIYYYANRRCASRYAMITGLSDGMNGAARRRRILMEELRAHPPRLILVLFDQQPFEEWKAFLNEYYGEPIGWDLHDRTRQPIMFVLARKDAPIEPIDWDWDRSSVGGWMLGQRAR